MGGLWRGLGRTYRGWQGATGFPRAVNRMIGPFGPFRLHGRFAFSNFDQWGKGHNSAFEVCVRACRDTHCVIDVGAHIGLVSLPASRMVAPGGRVFAFEPAAGNLQFLRDHRALNDLDNLHIVDMLVGETDAERIPFFETSGDSGLNSVVANPKSSNVGRSFRQQVSIDSFCAARDLAPDIIKIDVEGYELQVLRGAANTLRQARPLIFLSVHPSQIAALGGSLEELVQILSRLGYEPQLPDGRKAERLEFNEYVLRPVTRQHPE